MALSACRTGVGWLRTLKLGHRQPNPTLIWGNNMGSILLAKHPTTHQNIVIYYHYIRNKVATKQVVLVWILTATMVADVMTKGLNGPKHAGFSATVN